MENLFKFSLHFDKNKSNINPNRFFLYNYVKEFISSIKKLNNEEILDSEITLILTNIINKINNWLLNMIDDKDLQTGDIYYGFEENLEIYGWKNNKFQTRIDIKKLKNDVINLGY